MTKNSTIETELSIPVKTIQITQAIERYKKSRSTLVECAKDANAYIQIGKICLVDVDKMDLYMDYKYKSGEDYGFYRMFSKLNCDFDFDSQCLEWLKEIYKLYLTDTEQEVVSRLYGIYHEMETGTICANSLSKSAQRIYQIKSRALRKLRYRLIEYHTFESFNESDLHFNTITLLKCFPTYNTTLSSRAINALLRKGINNVYDMMQLSENDMMNIRNCGVTTRNEIIGYQNYIELVFGDCNEQNM